MRRSGIAAKVGSTHWVHTTDARRQLQVLTAGIPKDTLPAHPGLDATVPHAPKRKIILDIEEQKLAVKNALRYFDPKFHPVLAPEFKAEFDEYGHIYMYRFRPTSYEMRAYPITEYPGKCIRAKCMMFQIMNNLDRRVAQFPNELITYGGNGTVFSNWAQFLLTMHYLTEMDDLQTLVMYSGHPMGLFPSRRDSPRCVITNGLVVPDYSSLDDWSRMYALGVSIYGQMTAGSWAYIGPQGIVHGTTITILNAGRKYLGLESLAGKLYISSGLGGMSGAQAKAAMICGCVCLIAEIDESAIGKRHAQGWVKERYSDLRQAVARTKEAMAANEAVSIAYEGNIVDLWEYLADRVGTPDELIPHLASDQTSCHIPFSGGYYPAGINFAAAQRMMKDDPPAFRVAVQTSLRRHIAAIDVLAEKGMRFWDYGNSFLARCDEAGADVKNPNRGQLSVAADGNSGDFKYPSYVEDIMGDVFSLGFGPFRWICTSNDPRDLQKTDEIAAEVIKELLPLASPESQQQFRDNYLWVTNANQNRLVVGSQARILYSDARGRVNIAARFNEAVKRGDLSAPIVVSRDHHDVSGTDSPFRETADVRDGSYRCADMATQTFVGNGFRGATWVALHNGGGVGFGRAINGGFGLVLDGSTNAAEASRDLLFWDVANGLARRAWAGHPLANQSVAEAMSDDPKLRVTVGQIADTDLIEGLFQ